MLTSLNLSTEEYNALFLYLFGVITNAEYKNKVRNGYRLKQEVIDTSGYILRNCKLYLYAYNKAKQEGTKLPKRVHYKIGRLDAKLLKGLTLEGLNTSYKAFSLPQYTTIITHFITSPEFELYLDKLISKKLIFLIRSYGDSREDLKGFFKEIAIYHLYRTYPRYDNYAHFTNIGKGIISKRSGDLIKTRTAAKNQKLTRLSDGGFEAVHIPIDSIHTDEISTASKGRPTVPSVSELPVKGRAKKFLALLSGEYDEGFSKYLGQDNTEAAQLLRFNSYKSRLQKYMKVTPSQVTRLFERIKEANK